jgi:hypothetical protein
VRGEGFTSIKKRLDNVLDVLSSLGVEPNEHASSNVAAQLAVIKGAFKESKKVPVCCFSYDDCSRILCDVHGPLEAEQFMVKCRKCQAQIKQTLRIL